LSGQASVGKKYNCTAFLKQTPNFNFNLLLTVTSGVNGVLLALFNPVFVPYIRFIRLNKYQKNFIFQYKLQIRPVLELNRLVKFVNVRFSQ
jgi:hypothetical protein